MQTDTGGPTPLARTPRVALSFKSVGSFRSVGFASNASECWPDVEEEERQSREASELGEREPLVETDPVGQTRRRMSQVRPSLALDALRIGRLRLHPPRSPS